MMLQSSRLATKPQGLNPHWGIMVSDIYKYTYNKFYDHFLSIVSSVPISTDLHCHIFKPYLPSPPHGQDVTQGQFFSGV